ncbi:hypothetical protein HBH74_176330 [Parastagonospora nodorum]|nr:hypothetical protein HBH74_176330 [Parastagonospora nodorum]KAH6239767.1 hypothetical protein HBI15_032750 [Parastagonospora nodorum]
MAAQQFFHKSEHQYRRYKRKEANYHKQNDSWNPSINSAIKLKKRDSLTENDVRDQTHSILRDKASGIFPALLVNRIDRLPEQELEISLGSSFPYHARLFRIHNFPTAAADDSWAGPDALDFGGLGRHL